nr:odorant-binding protein 6 [Lytta caraganae]
MKLLLVLCCLISIVFAMDEELAQQMKEAFMDNVRNCATEVNATPDDLAALKQRTIPASHEGKCVIYCVHKIYKIQNDGGAIDADGGRQVLETLKDIDTDFYNKMLTLFNKCVDVPNDADPCVTAANFADCAITQAKSVRLSFLNTF